MNDSMAVAACSLKISSFMKVTDLSNNVDVYL